MPHCLAEIHEVYAALGILAVRSRAWREFLQPDAAGRRRESVEKERRREPVTPSAIIIRFSKGQCNRSSQARRCFHLYDQRSGDNPEYRLEHFKPTALLYVVDFRQSHAFRQPVRGSQTLGHRRRRDDAHQLRLRPRQGRPANLHPQKATARNSSTPVTATPVRPGRPERYAVRESYAERQAQGHEVPQLGEAEISAISEAVGIGARQVRGPQPESHQ